MSSGKRKSVDTDTLERVLHTKPSRPSKKRRLEESTESLAEQKIGTKVKRQVWTPMYIDAFFEGLYQHGKSFLGILHYMQAKIKKKNDATISNLTKDQVRFFYYRTWHKVSIMLAEFHPDATRKQLKLSCEDSSPPSADGKLSEHEEVDNLLDSSLEEAEGGEVSPRTPGAEHGSPDLNGNDPEKEPAVSAQVLTTSVAPADKLDVKKETIKDSVVVNGKNHSLDLVALVCYHKLRKKCPEQLLAQKLKELVYKGYTTIREKGKRKLKVKIPNCRALRGSIGLSSVDIPAVYPNNDCGYSEPEPFTPPDDSEHIVVELRPRSVTSWLYVQGLAQNPRVRLIVSASKPVSNILQYLSLKWHLKPSNGELISLYQSCAVDYTTVVSADFERQTLPSSSLGKGKSITKSDIEPMEDVKTQDTTGSSLADNYGVLQSDVVTIAGSRTKPTELASHELNDSSLTGVISVSVHPKPAHLLAEGKEARLLDIANDCTVEELHHRFSKPAKLQFLYDFPEREDNASTMPASSSKLATLCKMVEFIGHCEESRSAASSISMDTNSHASPKRISYVKLLPKRSPWKSPLSKYQRLKAGSPLKQMSVKRTRLNFTTVESSLGGTGYSQTFGSVLSSPSPSLPSIPSLSSMLPPVSASSTSPVKSDATISSPHLDSEKGPVNCLSVGGIKLNPLPAPAIELTSFDVMKSCGAAASCENRSFQSLSALQSTIEANSAKQIGSSTDLISAFDGNLSFTPPACANTCRLESDPKTLSNNGRSSPNIHVQVVGRHPEAAALQSPLLQFATHSLSNSHSEKAVTHVATIPNNPLPIITPLKPYSKPKRIKKHPGKSVQTRQLIPRPLSFLSNSSKPQQPVVSVNNENLSNPQPQINQNNLISQPNHSASNLNTSQIISLLQNLLHQAQSSNISNQRENKDASLSSPSVNIISTTDAPQHHLFTPEADVSSSGLNINQVVSETPSSCTEMHLPSEISSFCSAANNSAEIFNSSSDTVNELLRGLCSSSNDKSLQALSQETADVLPTFAKAVISTPVSVTNKSPTFCQDPSLGTSVDQTDFMELTGLFSQLKEVLQTPEKTRQHNVSENSISDVLNAFDSTPEKKTENAGFPVMDSTFRSLYDEGSVDYIQKFQEMASKMNQAS